MKDAADTVTEILETLELDKIRHRTVALIPAEVYER